MEVKDLIGELADRIQKAANVRAVFGEPIREGETVIVPVARILVRGGGGGGSDSTPEEAVPAGKHKGSGMGLGLNIVASPVGYIKMAPDGGAQFVQVVDKTRLLFGAMGLVGLTLWLAKTGMGMVRINRR